MCGIAGTISLTGERPDDLPVGAMLSALIHRGDSKPHAERLSWATIGCVRLKIIDFEHASQPMCDEQGRSLLVFNGEIYNFLALRESLEGAGHVFRGRSDTEVLLHAFLEWGENCLSQLHGMYSFVILDLQKRSFFAARDPLGIKPLYFGQKGTDWLFASEIHPLIQAGISDVQSLPGGAFISNGKLSPRVHLPPLTPQPASFDDARRTLRAKIAESVRAHLETRLPVAVLCSGGIDSSIILYEAAQAKPDLITAVSVGAADADDHLFAERLAAKLCVPFVFVEIDVDDMLSWIPDAVRTIESFEPNHIRAGTPCLALAAEIHHRGFKIALLGEGADEMFGGYEEFPAALRSGEQLKVIEGLLCRFTSELQQTQLQRVDRTLMHFGVEGRVPLLHLPLVQFIHRLPTEFKVTRTASGRVIGKYILREAYRGILPDEIVDRRKVPMGEGAGVGDNGPHGPFHCHAEEAVTEAEFEIMRKRFPEFNLRTREEVFYFQLFEQRFGALPLATRRPRTNLMATTR